VLHVPGPQVANATAVFVTQEAPIARESAKLVCLLPGRSEAIDSLSTGSISGRVLALDQSNMNRNLTVLIAEDNEDDAFLLERAFRNLGLQNPIRVLADGEDVLRYLQGHGLFADRQQFPFPSVIFLDIKMPKLTGFDVLQWLRDHSDYHVMPTIVLSTSEHPGDVTRAYQLGANAYLVKPSTLPDFQDVLRRAFDFWSVCAKPPLPNAGS
jgi:CheY-like chemotaxis protein